MMDAYNQTTIAIAVMMVVVMVGVGVFTVLIYACMKIGELKYSSSANLLERYKVKISCTSWTKTNANIHDSY